MDMIEKMSETHNAERGASSEVVLVSND